MKAFRLFMTFCILVPVILASAGFRWTDATDERASGIVGTWINSRPVRLDALKGRIVVLEFWNSNSRACRDRIVELNDLNNKYSGKGIVIISLTNEDKAEASDFLRRMIIEYPVVADAEKTFKAYDVPSVPHLIIIGPDGNVVWDHRYDRGCLAERLEKYLEEIPPTARPVKMETAIPQAEEDVRVSSDKVSEKTAQSGPGEDPALLLESADRYRAARRYTEALSMYRRIASEYPDTGPGRKAEERERELVSDPNLAVREETADIQRKCLSLLNMAKTYLANGMHGRARQKLEELITDYPGTDQAGEAASMLEGMAGD